ncbi:MAG: hypothetical protein JJV88_03245 [Sulfurovum sp.]|nr:hypothetical protein [Sulfurovaceae bacterium]
MIANFNKMNLAEQDMAIQLLTAARSKGWDLGMVGFILPEDIGNGFIGARIQIKRSEGYMALFLDQDGFIQDELVITEAQDVNASAYS